MFTSVHISKYKVYIWDYNKFGYEMFLFRNKYICIVQVEVCIHMSPRKKMKKNAGDSNEH